MQYRIQLTRLLVVKKALLIEQTVLRLYGIAEPMLEILLTMDDVSYIYVFYVRKVDFEISKLHLKAMTNAY